MRDLASFEVWFITGSQHLYGPETLETVARQAAEVAAALDASTSIPVRVVMKPVVVDADGIRAVMLEANAAPACVGVIAWMHTFSPAKMWVAGLDALQRPLLHLHTQYHQGIPWDGIDMDFMNLNQAAHGDREFGFIAARHAARAQGRRRALDRPGGPRADRGVDAGRGREAGLGDGTDRPVRRQHARRRGHRGRQGRGAAPARLQRQHLRRRRPRRTRRCRHGCRGRHARGDVPRRVRGRADPATRARRPPARSATAPGSRSACADSSKGARTRRSRRHSKTSTA